MGLEMGPKRVELAHQLVPNGSALATLINSKFPLTLAEAHDMQAAAHLLVCNSLCWKAKPSRERSIAGLLGAAQCCLLGAHKASYLGLSPRKRRLH
jgi:hypothetical protein